MKLTIGGEINQRELAMRLLDNRNLRRLKEWKDYDEEGFNKILNLGDVIDHEWEELQKKTRHKKERKADNG